MSEYRCSRVWVGTRESGSREWREDCPVHGEETEWFKTSEEAARLRERREQLDTLLGRGKKE